MKLKRVKLRDLDSEKLYMGCSVQGFLNSDAKIFKRLVTTAIRDEQGELAEVTIFSVVTLGEGKDAQVQIQDMFPKGAKVALKQPRLVRTGGKRLLCLEYASSVEILNYFSATSRVLDTMDPALLQKQGNIRFSKGCYEAAAQFFTLSLGKSGDVENVTFCYSNRAECRLRQGMYEKAIQDAQEALKADQGHVQSMLRLGKAYSGMQQHGKACEILHKAAALDSTDEFLKMELVRVEELSRQCRTGNYGKHLGEFILLGCPEDRVPELSDFFGPVEIKVTADGKGKGVFATRDVEIGELLVVSNPVAIVAQVEGETGSLVPDLVTSVVNKCIKSETLFNRLNRLAGDDSGDISMHILDPNRLENGDEPKQDDDTQQEDDDARQEKQEFQKIVKFVHTFCLSSHLRNSAGIWMLPSLVNSSCIPNMCKIEVGGALLFHAAARIKAGEELTVAYVDVHQPWATYRKKHFRDRKFECGCKRCQAEAKHFVKLRDISSQYQRWSRNSSQAAKLKMAKLAVEVEKQIGQVENDVEKGLLADDVKKYIRASYISAYSNYYFMQRRNEDVPPGQVPPLEVVSEALRDCTGGSKLNIRHLFDIGEDILASDVWRVCGREISQEALHTAIRQLVNGTGIGSRSLRSD